MLEVGEAVGQGFEETGREVFLKVGAAGEVGLARCLEPGDPAPRERVRGRITVEQVLEEERGAALPRQPGFMHPPRSEPHPRVVVQVAGGDEFVREVIDHRVTRCTGFDPPGELAVRQACERVQVVAPDLWPQR